MFPGQRFPCAPLSIESVCFRAVAPRWTCRPVNFDDPFSAFEEPSRRRSAGTGVGRRGQLPS